MFGRSKVRAGRLYDYDSKTRTAVRVHQAAFDSFKAHNHNERALPLTSRFQLTARTMSSVGKALWSDGKSNTNTTTQCPNCEKVMSVEAFKAEKNDMNMYDLVYSCERCGFRWFVLDSVIKSGR